MVSPGWVFDSRLIANGKEVKDAGLNLWSLGDGHNSSEKILLF